MIKSLKRQLPGLDNNIYLGSKMMVEEKTSPGWFHLKRNRNLSAGRTVRGYYFSSETVS